tara:strand:- start:2931 stop:3431 length:501 start_codon:yes stop_codon:yes gene_type:complete
MSESQYSVDVLNGLIVDLHTPINVLKDYTEQLHGEIDPEFRQGLYRFCLQALILNCAKYTEFCRDYGKVVNEVATEFAPLMNKFKSEIEIKGINSFRNDYIGHIRSKKLKRPLTTEETDAEIYKIVGSSALPFMDWICPDTPSTADSKTYLVGVLVLIRDEISKSL